MSGEQVNRMSEKVMIGLSIIALLCVLSGYAQPPQRDEGAAAHIFQISVAGMVPTVFIFLATVNRRRGLRSARPMLLAGATLMIAFAALYYLEHYR